MFTVMIFSQIHIVRFTVLYHFRSSYKVVFGHLYSVMLTILRFSKEFCRKTKSDQDKNKKKFPLSLKKIFSQKTARGKIMPIFHNLEQFGWKVAEEIWYWGCWIKHYMAHIIQFIVWYDSGAKCICFFHLGYSLNFTVVYHCQCHEGHTSAQAEV